MAETDSLLKRLVSLFSVDFATWLLGAPVQSATPLPSELPAATVAVDQLFRVRLMDAREVLLHLEFQGRRSHLPMPLRMLDYMPRLALTYRLDMESVVLYLGHGAGADDTGIHEVRGLHGTPVLAWQYRVVRLWQTPAETLLNLDRVALLALLGQTQMADPESALTAAVTRMRRMAAGEQRQHVVAAFLALLSDEEMIRMAERILAEDDLLAELDLPYLRRLREQGLVEGHEAGLAEGLTLGVQEGEATMLLRLLAIRFGPLSAESTARVRSADAATLLRWSERVLLATTLEAVFAD